MFRVLLVDDALTTRRLLGALTLTIICTSALAGCGKTDDEASASKQQIARDLSTRAQDMANSAATRLLEGLKETRCPRIDHVAALAEEFTKDVARQADEVSDAAVTKLKGGAKVARVSDAMDNLGDSVRDEAIAAQSDLLKTALEEDCRRRQELLEERTLIFEQRSTAFVNHFQLRLTLRP
jgi:hypothetical protein